MPTKAADAWPNLPTDFKAPPVAADHLGVARRLVILLACALAPTTIAAPTAQARRVLPDAAAAKLVKRSGFEPRPANYAANHRVPTRAEIAYFRAHSDLPYPYRGRVSGHYRGTTGAILQWGARKWGFSPDLFRAVAVVESWWKMSAVGDNGDSLGLMQVRRPYHCCYPLTGQSSAFNVDYYGAYLRTLYDGRQTWLNTVERGQTYRAGDLWGSVGEWASGRWHVAAGDVYVAKVRGRLADRIWTSAGGFNS